MHRRSFIQFSKSLFNPTLIVSFLIAVFIFGYDEYARNTGDPSLDGNLVDGSSGVAMDRIIIHQDGSAGQPNPPVNVSGKHLKVNGDFRITVTFLRSESRVSLRLYGKPPIVYDQWRYESPSIVIDVLPNLLSAKIWDGNSSGSMDMRSYAIPVSSRVILSLEHKKDRISISENNHVLGNMPDHGIFDSGTIWFGADTVTQNSGATLSALSAHAIGSGHVEIVPPPSLAGEKNNTNSLRAIADTPPRKLKIGVAVSVGPLLTDDRYRTLALGQFSMMTPENSMKPQFIHPEASVYAFEDADLLVDAALHSAMTVHGHALLYDKSSPDWMIKTPRLERQKMMLDHVRTVVTHFKGKVAEWDVVNEPFSRNRAPYNNGGSGLEPNMWFEAMGEEYIDLAFKEARAVDPSAKLYLNDYGAERDGEHWDALLSLVKRLKERGVPIDGVGFEAHVYSDGDYIDPIQLKKHMESLARLGLFARISEIDVIGSDPGEQINQYVSALDVCLREINCTSYTTWGITDRYGSTTLSDRYPLVYGTSLLWDKDYKAKPVYSALQKGLQQAL